MSFWDSRRRYGLDLFIMNDACADNTASCDAGAVPIENQRRAKERWPINAVFQIVPLDRDNAPIRNESFEAVGINISTNGIAVSHSKPLRRPRAVLTTKHLLDGDYCIEVEVAWTRPRSEGVYETGFKMVRRLA